MQLMPARNTLASKAALAFVVLAGALVNAGTASADIYHYTDADGVVHFTNTAPKDTKFKVYLKAAEAPRPRAGVVPFMPQDKDPSRFTRYDEWIRQAAGLYQIPEQLVRAVIKVESDYDPRAVSVSGARGLMQLMPDTADRLQVKDIDDPRENIFGGVRFLRILANDFNGDLSLTVAAYNAGGEAVMRYGGIPPYQQTRDYVVKVTNYYRRYRATHDVVEASLAY
jgi:soluble lytic murein transglycosylase-like protein